MCSLSSIHLLLLSGLSLTFGYPAYTDLTSTRTSTRTTLLTVIIHPQPSHSVTSPETPHPTLVTVASYPQPSPSTHSVVLSYPPHPTYTTHHSHHASTTRNHTSHHTHHSTTYPASTTRTHASHIPHPTYSPPHYSWERDNSQISSEFERRGEQCISLEVGDKCWQDKRNDGSASQAADTSIPSLGSQLTETERRGLECISLEIGDKCWQDKRNDAPALSAADAFIPNLEAEAPLVGMINVLDKREDVAQEHEKQEAAHSQLHAALSELPVYALPIYSVEKREDSLGEGPHVPHLRYPNAIKALLFILMAVLFIGTLAPAFA